MNDVSIDSLRKPDDHRPVSRRSTSGVWLLPAMLVAFALLAAILFRDRLRPSVAARTAPVLLLPSETRETAGADSRRTGRDGGVLLFQASGWIEPDPHPIRVSVKTDGFVEEVHALEGESVRTGQLLATLDDADARLAADRASAEARETEAAYAAHRASIAPAEAARRRADAEVSAAAAVLAEADDRWRRIDSLKPDDTSADERNAALRNRDTAAAAADTAEARRAEAAATVEALEAQTPRFAAAVDAALTASAAAQLALDRTRIHATADGVILRRFASPGLKRMAAMDDPDSSTIVTLYDPARLQARVDVPLAEAAKVVPGQTVRIIVALFPDRVFTARVTRITGEADLQRNTLQIKAALRHPDPRLRPEMLCRAEFLGSSTEAAATGNDRTGSERPWVNEAALTSIDDGRATVWVIDPVRRTAAPREVRLGDERRHGHRLVLEGVREGERTLLEIPPGLKSGARIRSADEETEP